ncbi:alpha/beta hydrolase [Luteimonas gilva]|uniref:Alpha/beta hydrolase n=1 Tax=Luteimonas gilva TaxID=2572684 RepID=A0A4U5JNJ1_9GAMM|nr:alpha/beta hydrolase [Luteimonas gilva]TKR30081.1 alpha/beta hydrolase [Luteimonas gilva]
MKRQRSIIAIALLLLAAAAPMPEARSAAASGEDAGAQALPAGTRAIRDVAYGPDPRQRFDVYLPPAARRAPAILLVHGGSWNFGDKDHPGLIPNKAGYWLPKGYALISVNYRMLPDTPPREQAQDVARALAAVQDRAAAWGVDRDRIALMGHSAGAHLVAVLAASPEWLREAGAAPPRGAVLLDSAAYDVERLMKGPHPRLYDRAFGADAAAWRAVSPYALLTRRSLPMLAVCSTRHVMASCAQARAFERKAAGLGVRVETLPQDLSHMQVNRTLGEASAYTEKIAAFLRSLGV